AGEARGGRQRAGCPCSGLRRRTAENVFSFVGFVGTCLGRPKGTSLPDRLYPQSFVGDGLQAVRDHRTRRVRPRRRSLKRISSLLMQNGGLERTSAAERSAPSMNPW